MSVKTVWDFQVRQKMYTKRRAAWGGETTGNRVVGRGSGQTSPGWAAAQLQPRVPCGVPAQGGQILLFILFCNEARNL